MELPADEVLAIGTCRHCGQDLQKTRSPAFWRHVATELVLCVDRMPEVLAADPLPMTPEQRKFRSKAAARERKALLADMPEDLRAAATRMRSWEREKRLQDKFEREVDPEGKLTPAERYKRAECARRAYVDQIKLKSAQTRRRRKAEQEGAPVPVETPAERALRASIRSNTRWAHEPNRRGATAAMRQGLEDRFEREVDPEGTLPPDERRKRAENARKAHYQRMALKSARKRRRARGELSLTAAERRLRSSIAANAYWATAPAEDRAARAAAARRGFEARFDKEVDPDGTLPSEVRRKLAEDARKAYYRGLAQKRGQGPPKSGR